MKYSNYISFLLFFFFSFSYSLNITSSSIELSYIQDITTSSSHLYIAYGEIGEFFLGEFDFNLNQIRNVSLTSFVDNEVFLIIDENNGYIFIVSGWSMATVSLDSFTIVYTGWGKSNFETAAAFTSDYSNLYVGTREKDQWGFNHFSLPDLTYISRFTLNSPTTCTSSGIPLDLGNTTFHYGQPFWCGGTGGLDANMGYCYGKVYPYPTKEEFRIYSIDLLTMTAINSLYGYMFTMNNHGSSSKLIATEDVIRNLLIESVDSNLIRDWVTLADDQEYETGISASANYIFVTGRLWGDQDQGTITRISQKDQTQNTFELPYMLLCGDGEFPNPNVAIDDNTYVASCYSYNTHTGYLVKFVFTN